MFIKILMTKNVELNEELSVAINFNKIQNYEILTNGKFTFVRHYFNKVLFVINKKILEHTKSKL